MKGLSRAIRIASCVWVISAVEFAWASQPDVIRFGVSTAGVGNPPRIQGGSLAAAQAHRYLEEAFAKDGISIQWTFFKGQGPAVNEALSNGQLDFATQGELPSIVGRSVGLNTRLLLVGARADAYLAVKQDSDIQSVFDLKGKRVAFHKGTATQLAANRILAQHGLQERDLRVLNLDPLASLAAFQSGDLDAMFGGINLLRLRELGSARIVYSTRDDPSGAILSHVLVHQAFAEKYPDITQRVVTALTKAAYWTSQESNRDEVIDLWAVGGITREMYQEDLKDIALKSRINPLFDPVTRDLYAASIEDALAFRLIRKSFNAEEWIDTRYLKQALIELDLQDYWDVQPRSVPVDTRKSSL